MSKRYDSPPAAPGTSISPEAEARAQFDVALAVARLASPVIDGPHGQRHIALPEGFRLHEAHDPHALPPHITSTLVTVDTRASFSAYVNRFSDARSILIADFDRLTVSGWLDWHADNDRGDNSLAAQPCDHVVNLVLRASEEYKRWHEIQGKFHSQAAFAAFLEENAVDVSHPEPAVLIEISRDLEGTQGVTFKSSTRLENGDRSFVYETETRARGDIKVPREFTLSIPLFAGEAPVDLRCAFRWRIDGGNLQMGFEWRRVEYQRQAYFAQIASAASEETGAPVFMGRVVS